MDNNDLLLRENMERIKHKIIVMSGKGGVGKSTVCVNLAYYAALQGHKVGVLDVDIHGPSVAKMTGIEGRRIVGDEDGKVRPIEAISNFFVVSIASMLESPDDPIILRGPAKMGAIKQFLSEIVWPELDYLFIDCPPGTGDEPLSVIQLIGDVTGAVIVSTPQQISLLDVRKSLNFAKKLDLPVLGIIENMSGFICPTCNTNHDIFKSNGTAQSGIDFGVEILGKIPIDPNIVTSSDDGKPFVYHYAKTKAGEEVNKIGEKLLNKIPDVKTKKQDTTKKEENNMSKIVALPLDNGILSEHFGHADKFVFFTLNGTKIESKTEKTPPPHQPGIIPAWLKEENANVVIVNGIGQAAVNIFNSHGIEVIRGVDCLTDEEVIKNFIENNLTDREVSCNHDQHHDCH
ncbi:MAG: hypothetical protein A2015_16150 [Spirochaetes bacterium GWF1_31_7]|nr:MAG: hypothetical protein A2Y30_13520 [Spirochaetes bacterium GWE1_32_154]OHD49983.1 MAG: hypothetical protein A2Y29_11565 [Spirochaetes bacterium GWE2_31_10]OHD52299.1 MAG: hypothetical protein A2015_16150 [Spirochaetes bacterium GWF1_31_7]OHD80993.1 MAG: hypothetical protein A2355_08585 [Spirochaetes bacterium RIFOXYB1_FULL_32_8]HBD95288.1 chromosome partitioning protein ParA [Spirochaetia bacterium]